ncbi:TetR family transcriptional regulator [Streptomonospora wellingtoniae]|uniref:TetR family transcriptional regulator n=1 Tax=Streptomonospora wellingtoniae TaxID=3075544 RepID=A0ABU2KVP5_9ACTN|nr:TetR family transcriptional regulator [Streptomonospora sp. DSM 45055]MDT0303354.1 TetR family transcriptional regulator [Streptomonospora sp. DSM 45055]
MGGDWRERKKARTRERIQREALRLFGEQGYDETTVAAIASAAGVSHTTFFRYFPTKEDVVLGDEYDPLIEEALRSRPRSEDLVERVRGAVGEGLAAVYAADRDALLARVHLVLGAPALRARLWEQLQDTQSLLERALADTDDPAEVPMRVRVVAAACLAVLTTAITAWNRGEGGAELPDLVDEAFLQLRAELA